MKKIVLYFFVIILSIGVFALGYEEKKQIAPNHVYQVYLDDQILGTVSSKKELEDYIDKKGEIFKTKYNVDKVYAPNGILINKIVTYNKKIDTVEEVYKKISELKSFTIEGVQLAIKKEKETKSVFVTDEQIINEALTNAVVTFVGQQEFNSYIDNAQSEIETTGQKIDNVYVDDVLTTRPLKVPVDENIFTNSKDLSKYILFGTTEEGNKYNVQAGDTIEKVAFNNKINVQEFLISNPEFTSIDNILYPGQEVSVAGANPIIDVVVEKTIVEDKVSFFTTEEKTSESMNLGDEYTVQEGANGVNRVTSISKSINGAIVYAENSKTEKIVPATNRIVMIGTKWQSGVGGRYWSWPTTVRTISTGYEYRFGAFHPALDIYNGYGTPIFAGNNGVVVNAQYHPSYGNYIEINHNNGYTSLYAHMNGFVLGIRKGSIVGRGQQIGYMGSTGNSTGPHLHYEIRLNGAHINPWSVY